MGGLLGCGNAELLLRCVVVVWDLKHPDHAGPPLTEMAASSVKMGRQIVFANDAPLMSL